MSLPAYLLLYDEYGILIGNTNKSSESMINELSEDRRNGIEIMSNLQMVRRDVCVEPVNMVT